MTRAEVGVIPHALLDRSRAVALATATWLLLAGCFLKKDLPLDGPVLESVEIVGGESVDRDRLREGLASRASPTFLFMRGVAFDYEVFDQALLERDLERVERYYRARGYYQAKVTGARVTWTTARSVRVAIFVSEGPPLALPGPTSSRMAVELRGLERIESAALLAELIAESPRPGQRFDERTYETSKTRMLDLLTENGYAFASIAGRVEADLARHEAYVTLDISPGTQAVFGEIQIVGLQSIPETQVRRGLLIESGDGYSSASLNDARRELVNLGVFTSVRVEADTSHADDPRVDVRFTVREAAPRTLRLGGGTRLDAVQFSGSLTASWEHKNFLGGLRHLTIESRPGLVFFPTRLSQLESLEAPQQALFQGSLGITFSQPSFIEGRTKGLLGTRLEVRPLLFADTESDQPLLGFLEASARAGLERPFFSHRLYVTPSLNWQGVIPIDHGALSIGGNSPPVDDSGLDNLLISYPELLVRWDLRDDSLDPKNGLLLSSSIQMATPALGGSLSDVRLKPEARFYYTKTTLTLAFRASTGLLFPDNYADRGNGDPDDGLEQQKLLFRGFFSGGPFSNRGYAFQQVNEHRVFTLARDARCELGTSDRRCRRPVGGLTSWEMSLELRFSSKWAAPLGLVLFVDASDVRSGRADYRFDEPHLSPGLGLRYPTPVGPVRLDVGVRVLELLGEDPPEQRLPELLGAPIAIHLAVGQAF